ncbi:reverse transcriptase domain-containing protein [Citrus sinensis]|uniref:Reverse transcriptase domain-containing protein n=1 Tax=Citrus sinensis TaxID=2711 RepID=A0ACB8ME32_CITSI|nr:reverse transcriptase domain-containing protein [Citrus sinensis]
MYRPISLCNVAYKTITKLLANRLQSILPSLIGPHQTSFVPGRHITENIVIAQEVVHSMRKKTGSTGFMAIKVDLEKAYNRLSWEFISDTLREARIPSDLIQVIMACITSVTMRVLWNGEATDEFSPSQGIRQGCPLSPYLFVLCIERLSHGIHNAISAGKWRPIGLSRHGTRLSHLFFADDLLLLAEATVEQARVISTVLAEFCACSNAKVNTSKTLLYFSKNMGARNVSAISGLLGFSVTFDLGKYLGVPLHHSRVSTNMYQGIIDKVEKRLSGWNASHLSLAGRITLAQSVLQAIPIYVMQIVSLPRGVCEKIDRACRRFIWSGSSPHEALASRRWSLGDGQSARFLWDLWVTDTVPLIAYATTTIPVGILDCKVADLVDVNGAWCWHRFDRYLPNHIILQIAALQPPSHMKDMDTFFWAHSKHGVFSTSSAYLALSEYDPKSADRDWQLVWKWKGPQSVRIFLWQAFHAGLKTKAELARRHLPISPCCDRCGAVCEDITHALRDCWLVKQFWLNIIPISKRHSFFNSRLHLWLCSNLAVNSKVGNVSNWAVFFGVAIWRIWYWRNQFLFNKLMLDPLALLVDVHTRAEEIHKLHNHPLLTRNIRTHMWISWHPPEWP